MLHCRFGEAAGYNAHLKEHPSREETVYPKPTQWLDPKGALCMRDHLQGAIQCLRKTCEIFSTKH